MDATCDRRTEPRLRYHWPIWFAENFDGELFSGQMADVSQHGAAFTCRANEQCPWPGQSVTARFSVPCYGPDDAFDVMDFIRSGQVCRVDHVNDVLRRVALQFAEPLPFSPAAQTTSAEQVDPVEDLEPMLV